MVFDNLHTYCDLESSGRCSMGFWPKCLKSNKPVFIFNLQYVNILSILAVSDS